MIRRITTKTEVYRDGELLATLTPVDGSEPSINVNADAEIKSSFFGHFYDLGENINWLTDTLQPVAVIDGTEYRFGEFLPAEIEVSKVDNVRTVSVSAYDRCWQLQTVKTENIMHFSAGSKYLDVVKNLLTDAGVTLYLETPSDAVLTTDREDWGIGTDYLEIINTLLDEINYSQVWFNSYGFAVLRPQEIPSASMVTFTFDEHDPNTMLISDVDGSTDIFNRANVFIVICENPDLEEPLIAVAENNNPASPLSIYARKRRICEVVRVDNIANQAALDEYAQLLVSESVMAASAVEILTPIVPDHGINDVVMLNFSGFDGFYSEVGWRISFKPGGMMQHSLRKVEYYFG